MTIDAPGTVLAGVLTVLALTTVLALRWDRARLTGRIALVTAVALSVAGTTALELNRLTETYPSWRELAGAAPPPVTHRRGPGAGQLVTYRVDGPASGISMPMSVYLPAAYLRPDARRLRFPVIEALHGYPGTPESWIRRLDIAGHLDREIAAGRMAPTVVLLPYQSPQRLLDTECTNLAGGPRTETYLTRDVPEWAGTHLRVRTDRAAWGLIGYSAGGFCAMNLALKHPGRYAAAASLSGYADPGIRVGDGSERTTNNIAWRLAHLPQPATALWIGWADDDRAARAGSRRIARLARAPLTVVTAVVPHGGHSHAVWRQMEGPALDWLSAHLARPAAPAAAQDR
ncbi:alpha/beta hydrolase [Actinoplanes teichomyceticus]|uniref:S-formylglutathione hydrolase FrmB n=1 Tax=Actinoplanes teichomyceticus TaxID=1867 RepID=A0A561VLH8_ACTTI|nr:alpha/beta hydrolase-fold protein [Actinoplanes teichomyceticus]TWG12476.1 S-formylglutathione hydrolase FrmB [Actinoplanes teichomyceticus]GIF13841.1 esterase [Actinoplanes teichomyceticus]